MSARDELLESLIPWSRRPADGEEDACNALINAFAHEMAEKIRAKADTLGDWDFTTRRDMRAAADLIDPESDVNRCSGCGDQQDNGQVHGYGAEFGGCV